MAREVPKSTEQITGRRTRQRLKLKTLPAGRKTNEEYLENQ
ncbi:26253_t:CDS:1, partial [Racocetra persica]